MSSDVSYLAVADTVDDPIKTAWENVILHGLPAGCGVRPEILNSWVQCREIGLDPFSRSSLPNPTGNRLARLLRWNSDLIDLSKPVMDLIEISVAGSGFILTLTDKTGRVLIAKGDKEIMEMAEANFYQPGSVRTTDHAGTNAIGLCLVVGRPVQVTGAEHYKVYHHPWTCSSAPILDNAGAVMGVITLSGCSSARHQHTLALVTAAAETVDSRLRERSLINEKGRLNWTLTSILDSMSDGVVAVDEGLMVTHLNRTAADMLGLRPVEVIGKRLNEAVSPDDNLVRALKTKKYFVGNETSFRVEERIKHYICRVDPIRNASMRELGAIITLAEKQGVIDTAKKIGGNYAKYRFSDIKGKNEAFLRQLELAKIAARTNSRILLLGESGTGKELFAQAIHNFSHRANGPFVAVSCAAIPRDLIESELFGYRAGAFTGARKDGMVGKFQLANKGTLFLDEIDGMPLDLQTKLLRVLQQNEIMRLGDTRSVPVDVRVISATNTDLFKEVEHLNFREDLYYRLNVVEIYIPPLRERAADLELLIDHIMTRRSNEMNIKEPRLSDEVLAILKSYNWPGNVRELENCIERAVMLAQGNVVRMEHLPERLWKRADRPDRGNLSLREGFREMVQEALQRSQGNVSIAARDLKIARSTLYRNMVKFGLQGD
jgi:PAS domain S-box-containing protein